MKILAYEAFIRRAAQVDAPFMLKGSFVGRHYFPSIDQRLPVDMDWLCLDRLEWAEAAEQLFSDWAQSVTSLQLDDGVIFTGFSENALWRNIDYAMFQDFPTMNTDITCAVDGCHVDFSFDISFNLPIPLAPAPLMFQPTRGDAFIVPKTAPLALQAAWKMHQTVVRPRIKDFYDLAHFFNHPDFDAAARRQALQAFAEECRVDETCPAPLYQFAHGEWDYLFPETAGEHEFLRWMKTDIKTWMKFLERAQDSGDDPQPIRENIELALKTCEEILSGGFLNDPAQNRPSFVVFKYFVLDACREAALTDLSEADLLALQA